MLYPLSNQTSLYNAFHDDVIRGLSAIRKSVPCRWLYDERGSELFEQITMLDDYYPSRIETAILRENAHDIAKFISHTVAVIEYGAGSGIKTEIFLRATSPSLYVPVDICGDYVAQTADRLARLFPAVEIRPLVADFGRTFTLPPGVVSRGDKTAFFPGSTIGNLTSLQAGALLRRMRFHTGASGRAIIGVDLTKDVRRLLRAYDDSEGVTAAFNLNFLERMNRELSATFNVDQFTHAARWNDKASAVEMHLVSRMRQDVAIGNRFFAFRRGETIHTESSRKYDVAAFRALARVNGWRVAAIWQDAQRDFAVFGLAAA